MKIFILTNDAYHDNGMLFGAYSTELKARDAITTFRPDPENNWKPSRIMSIELDKSATAGAARAVT